MSVWDIVIIIFVTGLNISWVAVSWTHAREKADINRLKAMTVAQKELGSPVAGQSWPNRENL